MRALSFIIVFFIISTTIFAELPVGQIPPKIILEGDLGGRLDGTSWSSEFSLG